MLCRVYGVTTNGYVFNTYGSQQTFGLLPTTYDIKSNSLAHGGEVDDNIGLFGVDCYNRLIRFYYDSGWHSEVFKVSWRDYRPQAGSLISGKDSLYGVTDHGAGIYIYILGSTPKYNLLPGNPH